MAQGVSSLEIERKYFTNLVQAIRSSDTSLINKEAYAFRDYLNRHESHFSASLRLLEYVGLLSLDSSNKLSLAGISEKINFNLDQEIPINYQSKEDFCIALFTFNSTERSHLVLESLRRSGHIHDVEVFMDGGHGIPKLVNQVNRNKSLVSSFHPKKITSRRGNYGFRRVMIESLLDLSSRYKTFLVLEDDCFPTSNAVEIFKSELEKYKNHKEVLTVYGSHFLVDGEFPLCPRFQGWGWATWSEKIIPYLHKMMRLYLLPEPDYLDFIHSTTTPSVTQKIDEFTSPRSSSITTHKFYAWDETLTHLSALENKYHRPTQKRCIYNFGMDENSSHFPISREKVLRKPPYNLISQEEVWDFY